MSSGKSKKRRSVPNDKIAAKSSRRRFLTTAAAATVGGATLGFPMISRAQAVSMRFQSTWPTKDIFHEFAIDYVNKVNEMSGGRLKIEMLPAGAVVKAFDLLDAVHKGTLDGGHGVTAYHVGRNPAFSLFGTGPSFGMDANMILAWFYYGGGKELYEELQHKIMGLDVVGFVTGPMPTQPLGWFKKGAIKGPGDFKGMKFRTVGLSKDNYEKLGAAVVALPGGEIVPAIDRGVIEAAEFNNASSDRLLGFPDVAKHNMLQSYHQPCEVFEVLFNKKKYDALPADLKAVIKYASEAASADMSWKAIHRYSIDFWEMEEKQGVKYHRTPESVLKAQLKAWDEIVADKTKEPFFAKVIDSQKKFASRVIRWNEETTVPARYAYEHYWKGKKRLG
jgi:TRAP-type mannitol/chloroaromatic compound transport system substrate-binding protein